MDNKKKLSYAQALSELEMIVEEIESEKIDVDVLSERVKRASHLIHFCKTQLKKTEEEIKKTLSEL